VTHFDVAKLREDLIEYQEDMGSPGFWDNLERAQRVSAAAHQVEGKIRHFEALSARADDIEVLMELAEETDDSSTIPEIKQEIASVREELEALKLTTLLNGEYDGLNALLSLHAGAGGTEAQDWAEMLYRMYGKGWKVEIVSASPSELGGYREGIARIAGEGAHAKLKFESGGHRVQRVPETVNTTDSAVRLTHLPTGIVVSMQNEKSQIQNRAAALRVLQSRLLLLRQEQEQAEKRALAGDVKASWGDQMRSYVLHPYQMVKDLRTE